MELNQFEFMIIRKIVEKYGLLFHEARDVVYTYLPVIRLLDDDHDGANVQAEMYYNANKNNIPVDEWVKHINKVRQK